MTWKTNAIGFTVDGTMNVDFALMKSQGASFVVIDAGTGFDANPNFSDQVSRANAAGLGVILQYVPYPAIDDYTFDGVPVEQCNFLQKQLANKKFNALVISVERYWTGKDIETNHIPVRVAGDTAINNTAATIYHTMAKAYPTIPVMIRSNDGFTQRYSPSLSNWTDSTGYFLADWRYRLRAADGTWTIYSLYDTRIPVTLTSIAALREVCPPDNSKNPPVPGNAPSLKFWEFSGDKYALPFAKGWNNATKYLKCILFNGDDTALKTYLNIATSVENPPSGGGTTGGSTTNVDLSNYVTKQDFSIVTQKLSAIDDSLNALNATLASLKQALESLKADYDGHVHTMSKHS